MLVVCTYLRWYIRISENGQFAVWLGNDGGALDVLIASKSDVDGRITQGLQQLSAWMLVQHSFAECSKFLPFVATVLKQKDVRPLHVQGCYESYHKLLVPDTDWEVAIECDTEVIRVVTLLCDDVFQQGCL